VKFGLFYQLPCADSQSEPARYHETLEQIRVADELGFDCAWLAELHFFKSFSIMPSPLIVAAVAVLQTIIADEPWRLAWVKEWLAQQERKEERGWVEEALNRYRVLEAKAYAELMVEEDRLRREFGP
jgi:hypothetical protein